jgi:hypothetical protein
MPTFMEAFVLWILLSIIASFLGAKSLVIFINCLVIIMIVAGFFIGIGIQVFNYLL